MSPYLPAGCADFDPLAEMLPILDAVALQEVLRAYAVASAVSLDGLHMKHPSLVAYSGAAALALVLALMELVGELPLSVSWVVMALLAKPAGGFRPIGIFPMIYRLYGRLRLPILRAWEDKHELDEFACGPGKSAADTVWRQALASEASVASGGCAGAVLLDMQKFYERFNRDRLWARAKQFGMNLLVIRFALVAYSASRLVCLGGLYSQGCFAVRGIIAGCSFSRAIVRVYCLPAVLALKQRCPSVTSDFYIDDITIAAQASSPGSVVSRVSHAVGFLEHLTAVDLDAKIAAAKGAIVASTTKLAAALHVAVGQQVGKLAAVATNLGVDFLGKARRHRGPGCRRSQRFVTAARRARRLRTLTKAAGFKSKLGDFLPVQRCACGSLRCRG